MEGRIDKRSRRGGRGGRGAGGGGGGGRGGRGPRGGKNLSSSELDQQMENYFGRTDTLDNTLDSYWKGEEEKAAAAPAVAEKKEGEDEN